MWRFILLSALALLPLCGQAQTINPQSGINPNGGNASGANVTATGGLTGRSLAARAADDYNVLDYGVKGDCSTDDSVAINALLTTIIGTGSAAVHFPRPPGGCYKVASAIQWPSPVSAGNFISPIHLYGDGESVSVIKASAAMDAVIVSPSGFTQHGEISGLWIDAAGQATYGIHIVNGAFSIHDNTVLNGYTADMKIDYSSRLFNNYLWNQDTIFTTAGAMPLYNLYVTGVDVQVIGGYFVNAKTANVYDTGGVDNEYIGTHAFNYSASIGYNTFGSYNYEVNGGRLVGNFADTSTVAGIYITGFAATVTGNNVLWATGATPGYGILLASGVQNAYVSGNNALSAISSANMVVQAGTAGANSVIANNVGSLYGNQGPILSGVGSTYLSTIAGYLGSFGRMTGSGDFGLGTSVDDFYRVNGWVMASGSQSGYTGDSQTWRVIMRGSATSGTIDLLSNGNGTRYYSNTMTLSLYNIPSTVAVEADVVATCSTGDVGRWKADFTFKQPGTSGTVAFVSAAGTNVAPTWTTISLSSGALSAGWAPQVILDQTARSAVIQGTNSTCTGGKTVYWTAKIDTIESADGTN